MRGCEVWFFVLFILTDRYYITSLWTLLLRTYKYHVHEMNRGMRELNGAYSCSSMIRDNITIPLLHCTPTTVKLPPYHQYNYEYENRGIRELNWASSCSSVISDNITIPSLHYRPTTIKLLHYYQFNYEHKNRGMRGLNGASSCSSMIRVNITIHYIIAL